MLAYDTGQSVATINRRLSDFRDVFAEERNPMRLARTLRRALNDQTREVVPFAVEVRGGGRGVMVTR
jgi:hypothetical protein